ncbi:MAG: hypothetical protein A2172_03180 [Candidatus Woykebacteria bacterium RBG_13_40_15]|uniref:Inositol-1-monophosphatase n=1 Tax=Candidatus Woykebacteria bacterium RBG_13_40_15 TaxID=1802593 RepID=A0A1G1W5L0_9BACT|nr:MAG: hypothetical protein A2172_03180 [Candidatus Woykebacteria bacterium RBG_13_40_15]
MYLEVAIKAAKEAGKILKENYHKANKPTLKQDASWATEIDKLSENKIISIIKENFPTHSINAEESGFSKKDSEYLWLVDPLDGTTNYATHLPLFAVSIALVVKNEVQVGVVYDPVHENLYVAEKNKGARLNDAIIRVTATEKLKDSMIGYTRPWYIKEKFVKTFSKVELSTRTPKMLGSTALHLCYVASGVLDASIVFPPSSWDFAAGVLIVEEAGGKVTELSGKPWSLESKDILATNGKIHEQLLEILKE